GRGDGGRGGRRAGRGGPRADLRGVAREATRRRVLGCGGRAGGRRKRGGHGDGEGASRAAHPHASAVAGGGLENAPPAMLRMTSIPWLLLICAMKQTAKSFVMSLPLAPQIGLPRYIWSNTSQPATAARIRVTGKVNSDAYDLSARIGPVFSWRCRAAASENTLTKRPSTTATRAISMPVQWEARNVSSTGSESNSWLPSSTMKSVPL